MYFARDEYFRIRPVNVAANLATTFNDAVVGELTVWGKLDSRYADNGDLLIEGLESSGKYAARQNRRRN